MIRSIRWDASEHCSREPVAKDIPKLRLDDAVLGSCLALLLCALAAWSIHSPKRMDFAVYWYDIHSFMDSGTPLYGPDSAMGFPMLFRYPPPFVLLFYPLTLLSFQAAGCVWAIAEAVGITAVMAWSYKRLELAIDLKVGLVALGICAPYFYLSFKDGNMQWFVTALVLAAVLTAETQPALAGLALAVGIVVKLWPILFLPLFLIRERRKALLAATAWSAVIWVMPMFVFGAADYGQLLRDWSSQELANHVGLHDIWYPSQSLRGIFLRFFTDPALTLPYHAEFRDVHVLTLPPRLVVWLWAALSVPVFLYVGRKIWITTGFLRTQWDLLYFVLFSGLQPFCNWSSLVSLTPAVLMAAHLVSKKQSRWAWGITAVLCGLEYAASLSRFSTRLFEALGLHFLIMLSLGVTLWSASEAKAQTKFDGAGAACLE